MNDDPVTKALGNLTGKLPTPRLGLSETEKEALIARIGARTARDVIRAKADFPVRRIPFLFSTLDTQDVVDLLANDVAVALARALESGRRKVREA